MKRLACLGIVVAIVCFGLVCLAGPAVAYDEAKCKANVERLKKLVRPHKGLKLNFKTLLEAIDSIDEKEGGMDPKELESYIDIPFEDASWSKNFVKYMKEVEKYCVNK